MHREPPLQVDLALLRRKAAFAALLGPVMAEVYAPAWAQGSVLLAALPGDPAPRRLYVGTTNRTPESDTRDIFAWWDGRSDWITRAFGPPWLTPTDRGYELRRVNL